jgi:hypothetical protein
MHRANNRKARLKVEGLEDRSLLSTTLMITNFNVDLAHMQISTMPQVQTVQSQVQGELRTADSATRALTAQFLVQSSQPIVFGIQPDRLTQRPTAESMSALWGRLYTYQASTPQPTLSLPASTSQV